MYAATLFGPAYDTSDGHNAENIELFDTVGEAIEAMFERHRAHGHRPCHVVLSNRQDMAITFPAFNAGTSMQLFELEDMQVITPERLASIVAHVNTHEWDWYLILEDNGSDYYVRTHRA